jgi:hypothetical protein
MTLTVEARRHEHRLPFLARKRGVAAPRAHVAEGPFPRGWAKALKSWSECGVREQVEAVRTVMDDTTIGVDGGRTVTVAFTALTPFTDPGKLARSVALTLDKQTVAADPLFLAGVRRPDRSYMDRGTVATVSPRQRRNDHGQ